MRLSGLFLSISVLAWPICSELLGQNKTVVVKGHTLGESAADFLDREPHAKTGLENCLKERQDPKSRWYKKHAVECDSTIAVFTSNGRGLIPGDTRWTLGNGSLVRIETDSMFMNNDEYELPISVLADLIKKLGSPTSDLLGKMQNGFGATWNTHLYTWQLPDAHIELYTSERPSAYGHSGGEWTFKAETDSEYKLRLAAEKEKRGIFDQ